MHRPPTITKNKTTSMYNRKKYKESRRLHRCKLYDKDEYIGQKNQCIIVTAPGGLE